jgi:glycosyltransferase involved in cell wall biosynthesis
MSSTYRSLHTIQSLNNKLGGATHAGLNICRYLDAEGHPVEVLSTIDDGDEIDYLNYSYGHVKRNFVPRVFPKRWYNGSNLSEWLSTNLPRFNLVGIHAVFSFVTIRTAHHCRRLNIPYFLHPHGSLDPFDLKKRKFLKRLLGPVFIRPILKGCAGVICTSQMEADLLETYSTNPKKFIIPLPVPPLSRVVTARQQFRQKHKIPHDAFVILFISRIDYKKGLDFLLPAIASVRQTHKDVWFLIAGAGEESFVSKIRTKIEALGLTKITREIGFVSGVEKEAAFQAADLFALPSLNENFGIVIVEAMQSGLPVLISDQVYIHKDIVAARAGKICRPDPKDCVRVLGEMLVDRGQTSDMAARAVQLATTKFSPEAATGTLIKVYNEVLK